MRERGREGAKYVKGWYISLFKLKFTLASPWILRILVNIVIINININRSRENQINKVYKLDPAKLDCFEKCDVNNTVF